MGTATVLAVEDKMSISNLSLGLEHWLLQKSSRSPVSQELCSVTATVHLGPTLSALKIRCVRFWFGLFFEAKRGEGLASYLLWLGKTVILF